MFRFLTLFAALGLATSALAQDRKPSHCIALAQAPGLEFVQNAIFSEPLADFTIRLNYVAHSTFLIEAQDGTTIATDYAGTLGPTGLVPDVVTMNKAHSSHFTYTPDPRIPNVLTGWNPKGGAIDHRLEVGEVLIRNVSTDILAGFGAVTEELANSIFVFEIAGLCVAHLGHLHHTPTEAQFAALGRMDVIMAPVDGGRTLDLPSMIATLKRARASVVIPMHWFSIGGLQRFLAGMADEFEIEIRDQNFLEVSLKTLPARPTVVALRPTYLVDPE